MMVLDHSMVAMCAGGAIGYAAAEHKGYSPAAGIACGVLMGPIFSWVLFAVDGILRGDERQRCPHCREWVISGADVCSHCGHPTMSRPPSKPGPPRLVYSRKD